MPKKVKDLSQNPSQGDIAGEVENKIDTTSPIPSFLLNSFTI